MLRASRGIRQQASYDTPTARGGVRDFVDSSFLNSKRPKIPGGAWPVDMLRRKSMGDLQQIWFLLLKERNMLNSMKEHYQRHAEELGAWPAPSRLQLVEDSIENMKRVLRERDNKANDAAVAVFKDRLAKRQYRYPPGPQEPPGHHDPTSRVVLLLSRHVSEDRLRELFGRYDVFDDHKGIISVTVQPTAETLLEKEKAEENFTRWWWAQDDVEQYNRWHSSERQDAHSSTTTSASAAASPAAEDGTSFFDHSVEVELAPGQFLEETLDASTIPVPDGLDEKSLATTGSMLDRIRRDARTYSEKQPIQLGYFPNLTTPMPPPAGDRPVHPDEIFGPWEAVITYQDADGATYAKNELQITRIDGAEVLKMTTHLGDDEPAAAYCMRYDEAIGVEDAATSREKNWPHMPSWSDDYDEALNKDAASIIQHNWNNSIDYMEREALLTGKSVWEMPVPIDPTNGDQVHVPPGAKKPEDNFPKPSRLHTHIVPQ